jgi:hypothetical protein
VSSLSVLCITRDPGSQVVAVLRPLCDIADEIVVVADSRVSDEDLAQYATVSDRLLLYEFAAPVERPYGWAHAQCQGRWVLRIDGDEVLSPELIERLPRLIARRDRIQYWLPRRWCHPDAGHWLDEKPWAPDYQGRLVRNDPATLGFPGLMHSSAIPREPRELVEEPMYHLDLLLHDRAAREAKAREYEALRPGLSASGGGPQNLYYLPEEWAAGSPAKTPSGATTLIRSVLEPAFVTTSQATDRTTLGVGTREAIDACWDARTVPSGDYAATLTSLDRDGGFAPGEHGSLTVRVTNEGATPWPGGLDRHPLIRLGHRWLAPDGVLMDDCTARSRLLSSVQPGESVVAPVDIVAPEQAGNYIIEVDLVHEFVRWFDCSVRIPVRVRTRRPAS